MPLPTADLPAPIAVLMLAWDEAAPAVRTLVEATRASTPTVDSVLVMVPQAEAPPALDEHELVLLASPEPEPSSLAQKTEAPASPAEISTPSTTASLGDEVPLPASPGALIAEQAELAPSQLLPNEAVAPSTLPAPALAWAAVRVLRLGSYSLPQLASRAGQPLPAPLWVGQAAIPSVPYQGATPSAIAPAPSLSPALDPATAKLPALVEELDTVPLLPATALAPATQPGSLPGTLAPAASQYIPVEGISQGALESDLPASDADELAPVDTASPDLLPPDELSQEPAQAGWAAALDSLREPAAILPTPLAPPEPAPAPSTAEVPAALRPVATDYTAPNLNFQVIQYARFAVPVALAEPSFTVIYAPAWPTWLAAQELRQRTGRPLVLHLASLAAPAGESAETAAGWMAELQRQALHRADVVLAETSALAQRLYHELGLAADTVRVVPAADAAAIAQALHEAQVRPAANPA
jgi:hypothetical protein